MQNVLRLDFGESYLNRQDVASMLKNAFLATLRLALASMVWILVLTPLLGIGAAAKPGGLTDKFTRFYCLCGTAIPTFVLGFLLIRLFAVRWRILPAISDGTLKSYLLPSFTLSLSHIAYFVQMLRNEMLENRSGAFVLYARARGIGEKRIFRTHLLKNSMQPVVNTVGISIGRLIAGTVVVENVFSWPGLGLLITKAILSRDYPVIQGYILIIALVYILANFVSDLLSTLVDPRIRLGKGESA
jgi:ABC-type dipeptide/oligopeptide/nickel transport system permease component